MRIKEKAGKQYWKLKKDLPFDIKNNLTTVM